jgi:hypothetical protein
MPQQQAAFILADIFRPDKKGCNRLKQPAFYGDILWIFMGTIYDYI